jgi:isopentenyl-diphosphate Delta-isomerase
VADAPADLTIRPNPDEVMETRWITLHDLERELSEAPDRFTPWLRIYMAEHRNAIFGALAPT